MALEPQDGLGNVALCLGEGAADLLFGGLRLFRDELHVLLRDGGRLCLEPRLAGDLEGPNPLHGHRHHLGGVEDIVPLRRGDDDPLHPIERFHRHAHLVHHLLHFPGVYFSWEHPLSLPSRTFTAGP